MPFRALFALMSLVLAALGCPGSSSEVRPETPKNGQIRGLGELARAEARRDFGVGALVKLATSPDPALRKRALLGLGRVASSDAIAALTRALSDPDAAIRRQAALALGITGVETAESALVALFERDDSDVPTRVTVLEALGRTGTKASLPVLANALTDRRIAEQAALALGRFGRRGIALDHHARHSLLQAAITAVQAEQARTRYAVAFALVREQDPPADKRVIATLVDLAGDRDPETRAFALSALSRRDAGSQAMIPALKDPDWRVQASAARGLARAGASADDRAALAASMIREWTVLADQQFRSPRIHIITEALRGLGHAAREPDVLKAADALFRSARDVLASRPSGPAALAASTVHCLAAAMRVRGGGSTDELVAELTGCGGPLDRGMPEHERRIALAQVVGAGHGGTAAERQAHLSTLFAHRDSRVRAAALSVFGDIAGDRATSPTFVDALVSMLDRALADPAVEAAGTAADAAAGIIQALRGASGDSDATLHPRAAQHIATLDAALLNRARAEAGNIELVITLINALIKAEASGATALCRDAHSHPNRSVRDAGRQCVKALGGTDPGPGKPANPPALPPADPSSVIGAQVTLAIATSKGDIEVALDPEAAPWHVAAIVDLANRGFYRDLTWHRVVPNFVVQGGDPSGSGWGGPPFVIPAEPSGRSYHRGTVGIADAGFDTGGSQWFIMHSRAPHLDGRYTVIGQVVRGQDVVDMLVVGDRITDARARVQPLQP